MIERAIVTLLSAQALKLIKRDEEAIRDRRYIDVLSFKEFYAANEFLDYVELCAENGWYHG
jgi:hypothetical protein